ncbi:MAG: DUF1929 domain-containing protein [Acidobacteriia bacterium]|nr:DUF1929 domain-containing protein [Terriglobia bacterium]
MAIVFNQVPDWTSWENQGANAAVADLDKDGMPELIVLRVDHPTPGPNRGFYRVGRKLDAQGNVTGGWGPWIEIPNWGSNENQGAGVAVADFGALGLALVVLQVQHLVPGPNRGLFRIGRKLDSQGNVTGGWTDWQQVPGWTSWRNQGAAITVTDLDGDKQPELVVFHIDDFHGDNPRFPNQAFYRVGSHLTADAQVAAWTDWIPVDWFSWFNQGAGVAVADLDANGRPEIVVFQIDNPPGENVGFYRVGWNLDQQGRVQDGWGPWVRVDGWRSFEDEGGGFALASFGGGRPKAVIFHVDNPPALNAGLFAVTDLTLDIDTASTKGIWRRLPYFSEVLPVHAALLHTGKVLFFAGSGNSAFRFTSPNFGNEAAKIYTSVVWDPAKNVFDNKTFDHPPTLQRATGSVIDFFCCGHTFLPDGRLLVAGGTNQYDKVIVNGVMHDAGHGFAGIRDVVVFNPDTEDWRVLQPMTHGRWYPTVITLSDGTVLAASGLDEQAKGLDNNTLETNTDPDHAAWVKTRDFVLPLYPHLFQLADGPVFYTGGKMDTLGNSDPLVFDPLHATQAVMIKDLTDVGQCNQCASVLLPPAQAQVFMILGGGPEDPDDPQAPRGRATKRVAVVDFKSQKPAYATKRPMNHERMHVNAVLLPDRTVIAVGGGVTREASAKGALVDPQGGREVFEAEIYDPAKDTWSITAPATVARLYHSVALLLPDGRVVTAGGNPDKGSQVNWLPPDPLEEMRLEIFTPPYLFKKNSRPVIQNVQQEIAYGSNVAIRTAQANQIKWINLIRPGLTTHSFNGTQRLVDVPFKTAPPDVLNAAIPKDRTSAPPGWYMLFLTDNDGVPSVGSWVHLS